MPPSLLFYHRMPSRRSSYSRVMVKLSGESLLGSRHAGIDPEYTRELAKELVAVHKKGIELAITVGGGNFFRGHAAAEHGMDRATGDAVGMLATVMNAIALQNALERAGARVHVQSAIAMEQIAQFYVRRRALQYLSKGHIVIFAAGTGNPFFSTDMASVLRALETNCEVVLKGTMVDGVYTKDPKKHTSATKFTSLRLLEAVNDPNITVFDNSALTLCADNNLPIVIFDVRERGMLIKAARGERVGTLIH